MDEKSPKKPKPSPKTPAKKKLSVDAIKENAMPENTKEVVPKEKFN
jgi:hypothetical protein